MTATLSDLLEKINLSMDDSLEQFCDVITDNFLDESQALLAPGETRLFGNDCEIEMLSTEPICVDENHTFLSGLIKPWRWDINSLNFAHSRAHFHTQAESNNKIDVIWTVEEPSDPEQATEYYPIAVYFEENEEEVFGEGPNYDPRETGYWQDFLYDMGIERDPFLDLEENK